MFFDNILNLFKKTPSNDQKPTIIMHEKVNEDRSYSGLSEDEMAEIENHVKKYIGPYDKVLHELISDGMHLDLIYVPARKEFPFHTFVTMGASEKPMTVPEKYSGSKYAEYMIFLPQSWPISMEAWKDNEANYWPIRMLKSISRIPFEFSSWLGYGHTIPNGNPPIFYDKSTKLKGCMITFPYLIQDVNVARMRSESKNIDFWCIAPLYEEEWEFKLQQGADKLEDIASDKQIPLVLIDPQRPRVV